MSPQHDAPDGVVQFRQERLTPEALLAGLTDTPAPKRFLSLPPGIGKTFALAALVCFLRLYDFFDRVILLVDQNRTLHELRPALERDLPPAIRKATLYLEPRPRHQCGDRDGQWARLEAAGCGALARASLCSSCPHRDRCGWLPQADRRRLAEARLVVGVQAYARLYQELLAPLSDGGKTLVLLDEPVAATEPKTRRCARSDLIRTRHACQSLAGEVDAADACRLGRLDRAVQHLLGRKEPSRLPGIPALGPDLTVALQQAGDGLYPGGFRNVIHDLQQLRRQRSGWFVTGGDVAWHEPLPVQHHTVLIATTGAPLVLVREKIALPDLEELYPRLENTHPGTRIFNLQTHHGSRRNFHTHAPQLLDLFAGIVVTELQAGHRVLLVACKEHLGVCKDGLEDRIATLTGERVPIETPDPDETALDPEVRLALVNFGVTGSNTLEHFDTCLALDSYYVSDQVLRAQLSDLLVGNPQPKVTIADDAEGLRRLVFDSDDPTLHEVAQALFHHLEAGVVLQAIGRVRPATHPRTVLVQQRTRLGLGYDRVFHSLEQARGFYGIESRRAAGVRSIGGQIQRLRESGARQVEVARHLGVTVRTVQRHWRRHET